MRSVYRNGSLLDFFFGYVSIEQSDVVSDVTGKDKDILLYLSDGTSDLAGRQILDVDIVNKDLTLLNIIVAADQVQN